MSSGLQQHHWRLRYETGLHDLVEEFYVPALSQSVRYDRKAGFFSSSALVVAATGVAKLVANGGSMRLLVGVKLTADDCQAMAQGYRQREEVIADALRRDWTAIAGDDIARDRLAALAQLIAREALDIRVVAALDEHGHPLGADDAAGMFHEKTGIFTDAAGDQVAFVGSVNESEQAWRRNIEHLSVFCSWREDADHAAEVIADFERMWEGRHPRALTLPFPEALREGLLELRQDDLPEYDPAEQAFWAARAIRVERERWLVQFLRDAPLLANGEALVEEFAAVTPWPHQRLVAQRVCADYPDRWYMLCDEVGLGKTIEAGLVLRTLTMRQQVRRALILAPKNLIKQWQEELREKFNLWAYWYTGQEFVDPLGRKLPAEGDGWDADYKIIIASEQLATRRERKEALLAARPWDIVLVDEAHHARRSWAPAQNRPNLLLRLLEALRECTQAMLLMTATPMQIEVRELWDLLRLSGMDGRWAVLPGVDFGRYFAILRQPQWSRDDLAFLTGMTHEFLVAGGEPDAALREEFRRLPGGAILWDQLTSRRRSPDPARVEESLQRPDVRPLMEWFFERHTPVRRFMFRATRKTLRAYRRQGLLTATVPERSVQDRFIPLGESQPLYDEIEDYISRLYRRAEAEKRHALGYVMTIYRQRLTSSPWAISETLRRRLEKALSMAEETEVEDEDERVLEDDEDEAMREIGRLDLGALWQEIEYIEGYLNRLRELGLDPKLRQLLSDLPRLRAEHPQVVIFTQYTDTMDFVREELVQTYGSDVACYSGRGGEAWDPGAARWGEVPKDDIKTGFADRRYWILVCTEAASEGLNLQTSDLLLNYDMPWNPMRVEQRIGRIDRIGQLREQVFVLNYYYAGSVEARIYEVLADRIDVFRRAVGPLQPVLGQVARRIERAAMAPADEKGAVLERELGQISNDIVAAREAGINVDELAQVGLSAMTLPKPPCRAEEVRDVLLGSGDLAGLWEVTEEEPGVYVGNLAQAGRDEQRAPRFTFQQTVLEARPTEVEHCLAWGDPLFDTLLAHVPAPSSNRWEALERTQQGQPGIEYLWHGPEGVRPITTLSDLRGCLGLLSVPPR